MPPRRRVEKRNGVPPSPKMKDRSSSTRPVSFIRIIASTILRQGKMDLPVEFVSRFGPELATVASVTVPSGDLWEVGLERIGNRISFAENLKEFIDFYGVLDYYLLIFTYTGDSNFTVVICDTAGAEIRYRLRITPPPPRHHHHHQAAPEIINVDDDDSVSVESILPISSSSDEEENESVSSSVFEVRIRRERRNKGKKKMRDKATVPRTSNKGMSSENPNFVAIVDKHGNIDIPDEFGRKYLFKDRKQLTVKLQQQCDGRQWDVALSERKAAINVIGGEGWGKFCRDKNVRAGDVCKIELIKKKPVIVLQISVYRPTT